MVAISNFQKSYKALNPAQKKAVDTLAGPVIVIAGPGTGKTQILALRVANILQQKLAEPEQILALAFSEAGVSAMRKRLVELIGHDGYYVPVFTFHGFCNNLILAYPEEFPEIQAGKNINEIAEVQIIKNLLDTAQLEHIKTFASPYFYLIAIKDAINNLKREAISPTRFADILAREEKELLAREDLYNTRGKYKGKMKGAYQDEQKRIFKNKELGIIFGAYQKHLAAQGLYDYNDMVLRVVEKLENDANFLVRVASRHTYILVDEHQDTNSAQNRVLRCLAEEENPNIFVVGDEKQAIFRFQGASLENFLSLRQLFPQAKLIALQDNYRSPQMLLDAAVAVMKNVQVILPPKLHAAGKPKTKKLAVERPITFSDFASAEDEQYFILRQIKAYLRKKVPASEIAVIAREHKDLEPIAAALAKSGIQFSWERPRSVFDDLWAWKLITVFRYLADFSNEEKLLPVLHIKEMGILPLDLYNLLAYRGTLHVKPRPTILEIMGNSGAYPDLRLLDRASLQKAFTTLCAWKTTAHNQTLLELFPEVASDLGVLRDLKFSEGLAHLKFLQVIFKQIKEVLAKNPRAQLAELVDIFNVTEEHNLRVKFTNTIRTENAVRLLSVHGAKGLEFDYVFIPNLSDSRWGGRKKPELLKLPELVSLAGETGRYDDERRIFFVALTRAKKHVYLSYAREDESGREYVPSIFLREIDDCLFTKVSPKPHSNTKDAPPLFLTPAPKESALARRDLQNFVTSHFKLQGLSVTALNNYLVCPWQYFYVNLLRVPRTPTISQFFGTAIHETLRAFFEKSNKGKRPDIKFVLAQFKKAVAALPLSEEQERLCREKGSRILPLYVKAYADYPKRKTLNEMRFSSYLDDIKLTGTLDKIEIGARGGNVTVVDYKTGRPKSRGEIEGKTKNADGGLKRQIVFYKLLLENAHPRKYIMQEGHLDFIEPDTKGKFHRELFVIGDEEVNALRGEIRRAAEEITTLAFWDKRCHDKKCPWCALRFTQA